MKKILWAVTFWLLPFSILFAQKYDYNWTFTDSAGIDFTDPQNPQTFKSSTPQNHSSAETQACFSDFEGNLLCYLGFNPSGDSLDQGILYNKRHQSIVNGKNIRINVIFANGVILTPFPNERNKYYLFHLDTRNQNLKYCDSIACTLYYSILRTRDDNIDSIKVIEKNKALLFGSFSSNLASVRHANGKDWWLFAHESVSNRFIRFLITPDGIKGPWFQAIGRGPTQEQKKKNSFYWGGEMVISPKGNKLAIAAGELDLLELFRLDRCSGILSDIKILGPPQMIQDGLRTYDFSGVSFSLDESKLYASRIRYPLNPPYRFNTILQFDLFGINDTIPSKILFESRYPDKPFVCTHELGPDGKIYIAVMGENSGAPDMRKRLSPYLYRINKPNELYPACDFQEKGFFLGEGRSMAGLPTFPVFRVDPIPTPAFRKDTILPDCPEYEHVLGEENPRYTYRWEDGSTDAFRMIPYTANIRKYIRWTYNANDTFCALRCDTFAVSFRRTHFIFSTSEKKSLCYGDSLKIGSLVNKCDTCYYAGYRLKDLPILTDYKPSPNR